MMSYRLPYQPIFQGTFMTSILRNTATTYTARIFTADPEHAFLGSLRLTTTGNEPTIGQIESAIRESARGLDAATSLAFHMRSENPSAYHIHIQPMRSSYPPDTKGDA